MTLAAPLARPAPVAPPAPTPTLALPLHPVHSALRRGLLADLREGRHVCPEALERHEDVRAPAPDGRPARLRVYTCLCLHGWPDAALRPPFERLPLEREVEALSGRRRVTLLKTHLDLTRLALAHGGGPFLYDLPAALERLGYRRQTHGAFDTRTLREHALRVRLLGQYWASLGLVRRDRELDLAESPLWLVSGRAAASRRLLVRPGGWWPHAMGGATARVPEALLALPTDGRGHAVERLALRLGVEAAAAREGGPRERTRPLGAWLGAAGVATLDALHDDLAAGGLRAKRLRAYLIGPDGLGGALALLAGLGAATLDVVDEADLWASGPGWLERFWGARLRVAAPAGDPSAIDLPAQRH